MKRIDLENMNHTVKNLSTERYSATGIKPRMVLVFQSNESRLARRIKNGKANVKIAKKNS
jgi:hypothetical protein